MTIYIYNKKSEIKNTFLNVNYCETIKEDNKKYLYIHHKLYTPEYYLLLQFGGVDSIRLLDSDKIMIKE